jgi:CRISPR-associated endonuclease Cas1
MASYNLPQYNLPHKSPVSKIGVMTLAGFGIRIRMQAGHLLLEHGVAADRHHVRLPRVGHRLKRIVCIGSDGYISLAALKWLAAQDASFVLLERNGKVQCVTGPVRPSEAKLRRSQALAAGNGVGLEIARTLIDAKLSGEERVLREQLNSPAAADVVSGFRQKLSSADSFDGIRIVEANAAAAYFREWHSLPVMWPKADLKKIPEHWRFAGSRQSPLSGGPRLAVTPVHAVLNYCFALLQAETRLCLSVLGLDPGLGIGLHTDSANRDSLALDVLEPIRPEIETWVLNWISSEPFRRSDFFETGTGNCRLVSRLCKKLSNTTSVWRKLVAPWAEYVAQALWTASKRKQQSDLIRPTRLTQQRRTEAKCGVWVPRIKLPKSEHLCPGCGKSIRDESKECARCAVGTATKKMVDAARIGRLTANGPEAQKKRARKARANALAQHSWKNSDQPRWLTTELFTKKIQPLLANVPMSVIRSSIGVSRWYASKIRQGYRPHPRHWEALAEVVGVSGEIQPQVQP